MGKGQDLYRKAKNLIPGGTQLLSKRPEMFLPENWPSYYDRAKGCTIWDLDGKEYTDMITMGIGACILGYADDDVDNAVKEAIAKGSMSSLNSYEEVELAELLLELHPWAEMVRYARTGGEAMTVAVRIGRAKSKKDIVLFCGYHGWHDWYLSANLNEDSALDGHLLPGLSPVGLPRALTGSSVAFNYNNSEEFLSLIEKYKNRVGVVVLESVRNEKPQPEFIKTLREVTQREGIIFIVDEITAGWRLNVGGAHLLFPLEPDIAVFAKGMSNGYPMAAIVGRKEVMQSAQDSFISSTYWTERIGSVAALAAIKKMRRLNVPEHLIQVGEKVQKGWKELADKHGLPIHLSGIYPLSHFSFEHEKPLAMKTLYTQEMLKKGFLASTVLYSSLAHQDEHVDRYLKATDEVFAIIAEAVKKGDPEKCLEGGVCHAGFKRLN